MGLLLDELPTSIMTQKIELISLWITVLIFIIGFTATVIQLIRQVRNDKSQLIINLYNDLLNDKELMALYYEIEHNKFKFVKPEFTGTLTEQTLDRLLSKLDTIAKVYTINKLKKHDLDFIAYELVTVYRNEEIRKYLLYIQKVFPKIKISPKFRSFTKTGEMLDTAMMYQYGKKKLKNESSEIVEVYNEIEKEKIFIARTDWGNDSIKRILVTLNPKLNIYPDDKDKDKYDKDYLCLWPNTFFYKFDKNKLTLIGKNIHSPETNLFKTPIEVLEKSELEIEKLKSDLLGSGFKYFK